MGTLREILSRWHGVIDHSSAEYLVMADYCAELLAEVEHLNRRIQSPAEDTT
jgi:hypothetical protein